MLTSPHGQHGPTWGSAYGEGWDIRYGRLPSHELSEADVSEGWQRIYFASDTRHVEIRTLSVSAINRSKLCKSGLRMCNSTNRAQKCRV